MTFEFCVKASSPLKLDRKIECSANSCRPRRCKSEGYAIFVIHFASWSSDDGFLDGLIYCRGERIMSYPFDRKSLQRGNNSL